MKKKAEQNCSAFNLLPSALYFDKYLAVAELKPKSTRNKEIKEFARVYKP
jgi:hypothetical protein